MSSKFLKYFYYWRKAKTQNSEIYSSQNLKPVLTQSSHLAIVVPSEKVVGNLQHLITQKIKSRSMKIVLKLIWFKNKVLSGQIEK